MFFKIWSIKPFVSILPDNVYAKNIPLLWRGQGEAKLPVRPKFLSKRH
jgi:hypothetical protein